MLTEQVCKIRVGSVDVKGKLHRIYVSFERVLIALRTFPYVWEYCCRTPILYIH